MDFKDSKSLSEFHNEKLYDALCKGVNNEEDISSLKKLFETTTLLHWNLFDVPIFNDGFDKTKENPDGTNLLEYILPTLKRVYSKFYINPPSILLQSSGTKRLELFQLQFDLVDFLTFLSSKFSKNSKILDDFQNLDKCIELFTLIVDDYLASKVSHILSMKVSNIQTEIRDIKISTKLDI